MIFDQIQKQIKEISTLGLAMVMGLISVASPSSAQDRQGIPVAYQVQKKHMLTDSIRILITNKGTLLFENEFDRVLANSGVDLRSGEFEPMQLGGDKDTDMNDPSLPKETRDLLTGMTKMLQTWLVGFSVNQKMRPSIRVGRTRYVAQFSRFGLTVDRKMLAALGKTNGAIFVLDAEVKDLNVTIQDITMSDLNNSILGEAGFRNVSIAKEKNSQNMIFRIPFYVSIKPNGLMHFQALDATSNLKQVRLTARYKELFTPKIFVEINGKKYAFNTGELDKQVRSALPQLLQNIQPSISNFIQNDLPQLLNKVSEEMLKETFEQISIMDPPGAPPNNEHHFLWGMRLHDLDQVSRGIELSISSFVEDPANPLKAPIENHKSNRRAEFQSVHTDRYDVGVAIDRAFINRMLQLSFERKFFENIPNQTGPAMSLSEIPTIEFQAGPKTGSKLLETYLKFNIALRAPKGTLKKGIFSLEDDALKEPFVVKFTLIGKMIEDPTDKKVKILYHSVPTDSVSIEDKYYKFLGQVFKGQVLDGVKKKIAEEIQRMASKKETIAAEVPIPLEILGIRLNIKQMAMENTGHLVFYLDYLNTTQPQLRRTP